MKKAKILEISSYPPPHSGWGVRVAMVKQELLRRGHECAVLNIGKSRKLKSTEYEDVQSGRDYVRKVLRYCLRGYQVHMHVNGQSPKGFALSLVSQVISMLSGRRSILTFHAGTHQTYFPRANSLLAVPILAAIFALSRRIICNDEAVKRHICKYGVRRKKIVPIPAFSAQYLDFQETPLQPALEQFFRQRQPVLSSYSLLRPTFHLDTTLRALAALKQTWPDLGMVFIGSTKRAEDMDAETIFRMAEELGLSRNIHWAGDLPHDTFLTVVKRSKIFVRTYVFDGICSSVLEALSMGVPVVGCENELRPKEVILFKTGDERDLAAKIEHVLRHHQQVQMQISPPAVRDTLAEEVDLLISA